VVCLCVFVYIEWRRGLNGVRNKCSIFCFNVSKFYDLVFFIFNQIIISVLASDCVSHYAVIQRKNL